jgi:hypothetical protein
VLGYIKIGKSEMLTARAEKGHLKASGGPFRPENDKSYRKASGIIHCSILNTQLAAE